MIDLSQCSSHCGLVLHRLIAAIDSGRRSLLECSRRSARSDSGLGMGVPDAIWMGKPWTWLGSRVSTATSTDGDGGNV